MGLAIFDKDAPVLAGLEQSFSRAQASIGGLADAVGSNELRHAPPTQLRAVGPRVTALSGSYQGRGGNSVFVVRNTGDNTYRVLQGNADGSTTQLASLADGSTLTGGFRSLNAALGAAASGEGFTDTETTNNYAVGALRAAQYAHGLLRIFCEVRKFNGSAWQPAQYAMFFSTDNGSTWAFEYRTADDAIGTERGQQWCLNPWPTPIYGRGGSPLMLMCVDADYKSKAGSPTTGIFTLSIFTRSSVFAGWNHLGSVELGAISNVDHGHTACAVECAVGGFASVQVVAVCGDGGDNNVIRRWLFDATEDINPAIPSSISGILDTGNWTLDATWKHGTAVSSGRGETANQITAAFAGENEGEILGLYDNESGVFGRFTPGDDSATAGAWETFGPLHPGGGNIALYCSTDGAGTITICMWDDSSRESDGTMVDTSASISKSPGVARIMLSRDWGETWTELARPANTDCQPAIAAGRVFWTEGQSNLVSRAIPTLRAIRPASVSPGGEGVYINHNSSDGAGNTINWAQVGAFSGSSYQIIQRAGGVFTDPDTSEVIPDPPSLTDTILKFTVAGTGGQSFGQIAWGRRHLNENPPTNNEVVGQVDTRFWILPALDSSGMLVGCTSLVHSGGGAGTGLFNGGGPRTYGKYHGRNRWYPVYDATTQWPTAAGGVRICSARWGADVGDPPVGSFYIVPDVGVKGGGGKVGQPIPLGGGGANGSAPDEVLTLTGVKLAGGSGAARVVCRIPWDSWHEWCNHDGSDAGVTTRTLWRLYADADNWIVAEWDGANHRVRVRVRSGGTTRTALVLHDGALGAMRETVIDFALGIDGDDLAVACAVAGDADTGTVTDGGLFSAALDQWRPGADESGALSAIEVLAVETFADGGDAAAMGTLLESMPGSTIGGVRSLRTRPVLGAIGRTRPNVGVI
jgi:hypothetical protein